MIVPPKSLQRSSLLRRLLLAQESGLVLVIILVMAGLTIFGGTKEKRVKDATTGEWTKITVNKFLDFENIVLLAKEASFIAIMAVGMTAIIVMGGIDLSVGSIYALAALLGAMALRALQAQWLHLDYSGTVPTAGGAPLWASVAVGVFVCCAVGAICGFANGGMVVGLKVHPFIITLGTMGALRGAVFIISKGTSVSSLPESFTSGFFKAQIGGVYPVPVLVMLLVALIGHVRIVMFAVVGMLAGLSAAANIGYLGASDANAGQGYELSVIAASVIGGAALSGGRGSALGAVLGAILIQLISNALIILEVDTNYTNIVMGAAIVIAVILDQAKGRLTSGR